MKISNLFQKTAKTVSGNVRKYNLLEMKELIKKSYGHKLFFTDITGHVRTYRTYGHARFAQKSEKFHVFFGGWLTSRSYAQPCVAPAARLSIGAVMH